MKASEALDVIGDALAEDFTVPRKRAGLVATMVTAAVLARLRVGFVPAVALSVAAGFAAERLYVVIGDVHRAAVLDIERSEMLLRLIERPADDCHCAD